MTEYLRLDYAALIREYEDRLETIERGFGMDAEFLDVWVPDDDIVKSLSFLFEAASDHRLPGLSVVLAADHIAAIDAERLQESVAGLGALAVEHGAAGGATLTVVFGRETDDSPADLGTIPGLAGLPRTYRDPLVRETRALTHRLQPALLAEVTRGYEAAGLRVVSRPFNGGTVVAAVDPDTHLVRTIRHADMPDNVLTRLLDVACREIEGGSLQEASEHGALRVENLLRTPGHPPAVRGLVTPRNVGAEFAALDRLIRDMYSEYRTKWQIPVGRNTSERPPSEAWMARSRDQRMAAAGQAAREFLAAQGIDDVTVEVTNLVGAAQVYLSLEGTTTEERKRTLFRQLEKELKRALEPRIELYQPPAHDKLRRDQISELKVIR